MTTLYINIAKSYSGCSKTKNRRKIKPNKQNNVIINKDMLVFCTNFLVNVKHIHLIISVTIWQRASSLILAPFHALQDSNHVFFLS